MKTKKVYWSFLALLGAIGLSIVFLGITVVWPRLPGNYNPATSIDGKGPFMDHGYLCPSRNGAKQCPATEFWGMVILYSPIGAYIGVASELRDHLFRSLFVVAVFYLLIMIALNLREERKSK